MVVSVCSVWGLLGLGGCLLHPKQGSSANTAFFKTPNAGMRIQGSFSPASVRKTQVSGTIPSSLQRGLSLGVSAGMLPLASH